MFFAKPSAGLLLNNLLISLHAQSRVYNTFFPAKPNSPAVVCVFVAMETAKKRPGRVTTLCANTETGFHVQVSCTPLAVTEQGPRHVSLPKGAAVSYTHLTLPTSSYV